MKWIIILTFLLASCGTSLSKDGLSSTAASTSAGVLATAVAGPALGAIAGVAAGVVIDAATKPPRRAIDLTKIPIADRANILKHQQTWAALEHIGVWIVGVGAFVLFILPLLAGYFVPNGRQRRMHKEMVEIKETLFDNPNIKLRNLKKGAGYG